MNKCKSIAVTVQRYGKHGEILHAGKLQWKKISFKFMFKCRQCHNWRQFWRKTVPGFCHRNTERSITDCLKMSLVQQDPLMTQNAEAVDLEDRRHAADCQLDMLVRDLSDTKTRVLQAWTIFAQIHATILPLFAWSWTTSLLSSSSCISVIWPTSSRRLPQRPPEQASDPPRLALSQCHVPRHRLVTARSMWLLRACEQSAVATSSSSWFR